MYMLSWIYILHWRKFVWNELKISLAQLIHSDYTLIPPAFKVSGLLKPDCLQIFWNQSSPQQLIGWWFVLIRQHHLEMLTTNPSPTILQRWHARLPLQSVMGCYKAPILNGAAVWATVAHLDMSSHSQLFWPVWPMAPGVACCHSAYVSIHTHTNTPTLHLFLLFYSSH